jgi:hypothetical protein
MPVTLSSGLALVLTGDAPFDPGDNWFTCPPGHFWLKVAAPEMGLPLFDVKKPILQSFEHAAVPRNRSEAARFARVCEMLDDNTAIWRGEWLVDFPKYRNLSADDLAVWENWVSSPGVGRVLDEIIELCARYADNSQGVSGYFLTPGPKSPLKERRVGPDNTVEIAVKIITPLFESLFETKPNEPAGSVFALAVGMALTGGALEGKGIDRYLSSMPFWRRVWSVVLEAYKVNRRVSRKRDP